MMSAEKRVRLLREAKPNSWVAFSEDESKVVAYGDTYSEVIREAAGAGETEPVLVKIPAQLGPAKFSLRLGIISFNLGFTAALSLGSRT